MPRSSRPDATAFTALLKPRQGLDGPFLVIIYEEKPEGWFARRMRRMDQPSWHENEVVFFSREEWTRDS